MPTFPNMKYMMYMKYDRTNLGDTIYTIYLVDCEKQDYFNNLQHN